MKRAVSAVKKAAPSQERRVISSPFSLRTTRSASGKDVRVISGLAVVWAPARSSNLGGFVEEIDPRAFDASLKRKDDVTALWNHDPNYPLARTTSGTLRLSKTKRGLAYEFDAGDQTYTQDLIKSMERGDVHSSSFGFMCTEDSWSEDKNTGVIVRKVLAAELFDVSPVTFPAYPDATSGVRALRTCPLDLRAKLTSKRDDDDDCEDNPDDDGCSENEDVMEVESKREDCQDDPDSDDCVCNEDSDSYDEDECEELNSNRAAKANADLLLRRLTY